MVSLSFALVEATCPLTNSSSNMRLLRCSRFRNLWKPIQNATQSQLEDLKLSLVNHFQQTKLREHLLTFWVWVRWRRLWDRVCRSHLLKKMATQILEWAKFLVLINLCSYKEKRMQTEKTQALPNSLQEKALLENSID